MPFNPAPEAPYAQRPGERGAALVLMLLCSTLLLWRAAPHPEDLRLGGRGLRLDDRDAGLLRGRGGPPGALT